MDHAIQKILSKDIDIDEAEIPPDFREGQSRSDVDDCEVSSDIEPEEDSEDLDDNEEEEEEEEEESVKVGRKRPASFLAGEKLETMSKAITKILASGPTTSLLSESKTLKARKQREAEQVRVDREKKQQRLELKRQAHVLPRARGEDPEADTREKAFQKTATRGVVQLFNAISRVQRKMKESEQVIGNKQKVVKLGKASFLSELRNRKQEEEDKTAERAGWEVLQEEFTGVQGGTKLKDWDKIHDDEKEENDNNDSSDGEW